ncbi:hypothetical protein [Candidatus Nitrosotenuis cloacae]|uniref:Uncharacterized protein n=1 Tax=Candidatus Nitrosotenuis cloacae TaxID=1603555 RepID=A0A3G1C128_9ARCH|nr:hypothetical protein [Candidatus Nitrosotenuis cloacae]AKD44121.1 hypothetical protein SU86_09380 [Candidatus Nitrosotenuis cloacae]
MSRTDVLHFIDIAIKRYEEEEVSYSRHLDQKAGTQTGYSGIISALMSVIFGLIQNGMLVQINNSLFITGIVFLILSIYHQLLF